MATIPVGCGPAAVVVALPLARRHGQAARVARRADAGENAKTALALLESLRCDTIAAGEALSLAMGGRAIQTPLKYVLH